VCGEEYKVAARKIIIRITLQPLLNLIPIAPTPFISAATTVVVPIFSVVKVIVIVIIIVLVFIIMFVALVFFPTCLVAGLR